MLIPFLKNNDSLKQLFIEECDIRGCLPQLSLAIGNCNKSLKHFEFEENEIGDGQLVDIITSLSMHPQLEIIEFAGMAIGGVNECTALSTLLRCTTYNCDIDDRGVGVLVQVLSNINTLQELHLSSNDSITIKGWKIVSTLLEKACSNLEKLDVSSNTIRGEGLLLLANALINNSVLKTLDLGYSISYGMTDWEPFSKLLCDTSTPNSTYLSNHTLQSFGNSIRLMPDDVQSYLELNKSENNGEVAMKKILQNHSHFNMRPFFEWEFKVLPIMISWFAKASACASDYEEDIEKLKLAAVYDFIREFPMLYVEACTKQELLEYSAMEITLRGSRMQHASILEEVQRCKTRALMRL